MSINVLRIALRNMFRQKRRSFMLGGAIAFGMFVITMINALTSGMVGNLKFNFSHIIGGQIFVSGSEVSDTGRVLGVIRNEQTIMKAVKDSKLNPRFITRRSEVFATFMNGSRRVTQSIQGVNWNEESYIRESLRFQKGGLAKINLSNAIILPAPAATELKVEVGETILAQISTMTGQQNVGEFLVIGILAKDTFGLFSAYAHLDYVNELLSIPKGQCQMVSFFINDFQAMDRQADFLSGKLSRYAKVVSRDEQKLGDAINQMMGEMMEDSGMTDEKETEGKSQEKSNKDNNLFAMGFGAQRVAPEDRWQGTRYQVTTLNDMMAPLMQVVSTLNLISWIVFVILLLITMVGILNTFRMILIERTREIGTIRALGMLKNQVRNTFLWEALFIALMGVLGGVVFTGFIALIISLINLPPTSMISLFLAQGHFSFNFSWWGIIVNCLTIALLSLAAAYLPARKAARLEPAQALRTYY